MIRTLRSLSAKTLFAALAGCVGLAAGPASASAPSYPAASIKLVVPWAPGGATDILGRVLAKSLTERIGQTVVVENRAGAGGNIGTSSFVREKADGYTLLVATSSTNAANPHLYKNLGFDPHKDFAPIAFVAKIPNVLEVPKDSQFTSYKQLMDFARENPGNLNYGSAGVGSSQHLASSLLMHLTGIDVVHIPFKGSGPAASALMGDQLDFMIDTGSVAQVKAGSLRALAVASENRTNALPDVPTFAEQGLPDMIAFAWYGIVAPAGTPKDIVDYLNKEINAVVQSPEVKQHLEGMGAQVPAPQSAQTFSTFMQTEIGRYGDLIKMSGAKME